MKRGKALRMFNEASRAARDLRIHDMEKNAQAVDLVAKTMWRMRKQIKRMVKSEKAMLEDIAESVAMARSTVGEVHSDTMNALGALITDRMEELKK